MRTSIFLVFIVIFSKITGFIRDMTTASAYGVTIQMDAYTVGSTVPAVIFGIIGTAVTTTLLPMFVREEKEKGPEETNKFLNVVLSNFLLIALLVIGVGILASKWIVKGVAPGFSGESYTLAVVLTMIGFPSILFMSLGAICAARLQSMNKLLAPSIIGITANAVLIAYLLLFNKDFGIHGLMVATVFSYMTEIMVMMPVLFASGWRPKFQVNFRHPLFKKMFILTLPVIIGSTVDQINVLVEKLLASFLEDGSVAALNWSYRLNALFTSLFASSIGVVIYYATANSGAEEDYEKLKKQVYVGLELIILLALPITLGILVFAEPIIQVVYGRGEFDARATAMSSYALTFYCLGILGVMARDLLSRTFYSMQDTKTPMKNGVVAVFLNIILSIILVNFMELGGLALAFALSLNFSGFMLYLLLNRKLKLKFHKQISLSLFKGIVAATGMIVPAYFLYPYLLSLGASTNSWRMVALFTTVVIATIIYLVLVYFFKFEIVEMLKEKIKGKFGKVRDVGD